VGAVVVVVVVVLVSAAEQLFHGPLLLQTGAL